MTRGMIGQTRKFLGLPRSGGAMTKRARLRRALVLENLERRVVFDASYFALSGGSLTQNWSNAALITVNDDWSGVPSIVGFLGQDIVTTTGVDARTVTGTSVVALDIDVVANQTAPNTATSGGVYEFAIADPVVALQGSGTADVPYLQLHLNTTGRNTVRLQANLRDVDGSVDNALQQINVQYRVGTSGVWSNVTGGYFADVSTGPSLATAVTPLDVTLPVAAENQSQIQVRVMTTNAVGSDEWIGVDDIVISSLASGGDTTPPTLVSIDDGDVDNNVLIGDLLTYTVTFNEDIDAATVTAADFNNAGSSTITIGTIAETTATSGVFTVQVTPTTAGDIILRIPTGAVIADVAGNAMVVPVQDDTTVVVSAADTTPPTVISIDDGDFDNLVAAGVALTYTVTFSEDIDASTVTSSDFTNSGTSSITIGTITETSPGIFTVVVTPTTSGTLILQIPTGQVITDVAGNALIVPVVDTDTVTVDGTPPLITSIVDNVSGGPSFIFQAVTYTVTFNEDIDGATVTAADFMNAGTATVTIGTIFETTATSGIFSVTITPTTLGTLILQVPTGAVISDAFGNTLAVPILDDTTITVIAATTLTAGDIAFTGIQSDDPDTFSFVLLKDVVAGTTIFVTDNRWDDVTNTLATNENTATFRFGSSFTAGTHFINVNGGAAPAFRVVGTSTSAGTVTSAISGLATTGDSLLAYQGTPPTSGSSSAWIAGVNTRSFNNGATGNNQTALPTALVVGTNAIELTTTATDLDNGAYNKATFIGSIVQIRADVNNIANWTTSDVLPFTSSNTVFTVSTTVTPTITATPLTKIYDNLAFSIAATADDGPSGAAADTNVVNFIYTYYAGLGLTGGVISAPKNVGSYSVDVSYLGNVDYNPVASTPFDFTITTASLPVTGLTGNNKVYDATVAATASGTATVAPLGSDVVTVGGTPAFTFADKNVGTAKSITATGYTLGGADAGNYSVVQPTGLSANVTTFALTGSVTAANKVFDGNTSATILTRTLATVFGGDTVSYIGGTATFDTSAVGNGKTVTATGLSLSGADAGNYTVNSVAITTANITLPAATISNAYVFYNDSGFETVGGVAAAIDNVGKQLLRSTGSVQLASINNISNYIQGINGLVFDVNNLAATTLTAADFVFRMRQNTVLETANPSTWANAPAPTVVNVTPGAPSRIRLEWANNVIQNTWLQVILRANSNTGLTSPVVYYIGSALGEGFGTVPYRVGVGELSAVQSAVSTTTRLITDVRDVDKNRRVGVGDLSFVQSHVSTVTLLHNINIPIAGSAAEGAPAPGPEFGSLFLANEGNGSSSTIAIPPVAIASSIANQTTASVKLMPVSGYALQASLPSSTPSSTDAAVSNLFASNLASPVAPSSSVESIDDFFIHFSKKKLGRV